MNEENNIVDIGQELEAQAGTESDSAKKGTLKFMILGGVIVILLLILIAVAAVAGLLGVRR